jgi:tape measure domain-containing protein
MSFGQGLAGATAKLGLAVFGLSQIKGAVGSAGQAMFGFNARAEQTSVALTTLLGSGDKASAMLRNLQQFAAQTPFEFPELAKASQQMLAFGFEADKVIPTLRSVGDAVAAMGGGSFEIDRVVRALGQMQAKGKLSAEEMMQITEVGIPGWDLVAKKIGVSTGELMKMTEKGLIPANVAIDALVEGMGTRFAGAMEAQSKTFNGLMSTLRDNLNMTLGKVMAPAFEVAKQELDKLVQFTNSADFSAWADDMAEGVGEMSREVAGFLRESGPELAATLKFIGEQSVQVAEDIATFVESLQDAKEKIDALRSDPGGAGKSLLSEIFAIEDGFLDDLWQALGAVEAKVKEVRAAAAGGGSSVGGSWADDEATALRQAAAAAMELQAAQQLLMEQNVANMFQQTSAELYALIAADAAAVEATNAVAAAQAGLSEAYQTSLGLQKVLSSANSEYSSQVKAIEGAVEELQARQAAGIPLTGQEIALLHNKDELIGRLTGGIADNTVQMGLAAAANVELMRAQDALNAMTRQGITEGDAYEQATRNVQGALENARQYGFNPSTEAAAATNGAMASLQGVVASKLIPAIEQLAAALDNLKAPPPIEIQVATAAAISEINRVKAVIASGAVMPFSVSPQGAASGFAAGGTVPKGGIVRINELGPELVKLPYMGAFAAGGTVGFANMGKSGFAALPKGAQVIPAHETRDILSGLDAVAEIAPAAAVGIDMVATALANAAALPSAISFTGPSGGHALSGFPGVYGSNVTGGGDIRLMQEGARFGKLQDFGTAPGEAALGMSALNSVSNVIYVELDGQMVAKKIAERQFQNQNGATVIGEV